MGAIFIIIIVAVIVTIIVTSHKASVSKREEAELQLGALRDRILVVTSGDIAGKTIREVKGVVMGTSKQAASTDSEFRLAENQAMIEMMERALGLGANAITDLKITTGSYEHQGSKWMVSKVTCYGTAVRI